MDVSDSSPTIISIGQHRLHVEPGVLRMVFTGRITGPEAQQIRQSVCEIGERMESVGMLADLCGMGVFDAGAREQFARVERDYPFYAVAFYGGSFSARILMETILRAGRLISRRSFSSFTFQFFATEAAARQYLEAVRPPKKSSPP